MGIGNHYGDNGYGSDGPLNVLPVSMLVLELLISSCSGSGLDRVTFSDPWDTSKHKASGG